MNTRHIIVPLSVLLLSFFIFKNTDVITQTFFPKETFVAQISLGGGSEREVLEFCSFANAVSAETARLVVFSEVAWMGTAESFSNEWIKLKNTSGKAVDVSGWQILDKDEQIKIILFDEIDSGEFLLLRRGTDYEGNLRNSEEGLRLFDGKCGLIDEVIAEPGWPAGDNKNKIPMKRNLEDFSWYTSTLTSIRKEVDSSSVTDRQADGKISINTAGYEELQKITGVGPVIAGRIIEYREENGPFGKLEDLKDVKGIGEATFLKMSGEISL